ncbi:MAG: hypothetical protein KKH83_05705 [Candidatus Margulisbacteria bacterium]|nr:hypothetical protein [Candidatus Margulisiibacteriota bacterium]
MTFGRAGSKFFHSLVDWHPQVMNFPRTFNYDDFWGKLPPEANIDQIADLFTDRYPRFFSCKEWYKFNKYDRSENLGSNMDETFSIDSSLFKKNLKELLSGKQIFRKVLFIALHQAYHLACGRDLPKKPFILYHIHDTNNLNSLGVCLEDFPVDTSLLVMARHPVGSINAVVKWMEMQGILSSGHLCFHQKQVLKGTSELCEQFPDLDIKVLPLEQLHQDIVGCMKAFVNWQGLDWHDSLLKSTRMGKLWWGNGKNPMNGVNPNIQIYSPKSWLEQKDLKVLTLVAKERLRKLGYLNTSSKNRPPSRLLALLPTAGEMQMLKHESLPVWLKYYALRVINYFSFANKFSTKKEKVPKLLCEK